MTDLEQQTTEWKEIKELWSKTRDCENIREQQYLKQQLNYKIKMYNITFQTKFDFFKKPE
jgi:hypothetical protein